MNSSTTHLRRLPLAAIGVALAALILTVAVDTGADTGGAAEAASAGGEPTVTIRGGAVRGVAVPGGYVFRGLPYAAAPTGDLRWRTPQPPAKWNGVRDATQFAPSCPQETNPFLNPFLPPGPLDEDCLYLNVSTPTLRRDADRPVLVWIHGGGLTQDAARNYDGYKLAAEGTVVVTINYRLGALGFLAHSAFAPWPGGPAGNYGLMDQQAALRWIQSNIARFGGDPDNVTIAGQSAGGLSVLAHVVSRGSRGLFDRAIVQSGAFALTQQFLADAKAFGQTFATNAGCANQSPDCLRALPVSALVGNFPGAAIPGVVDGKVLEESIGTALAGGRFARVPVLNGINHDEEFLFVAGLGVAVSGGTFVLVPGRPVTAANYQSNIAAVLGVPPAGAAAIAAEYPLDVYPAPVVALSTLVSDANFACPALQVDHWTSRRAPTFAYQFNDDSAPHRLAPPGALPPIATHSSELQYLFDQPNLPFPGTLNPDQEALAASMRTAWANFAASGDPSSNDDHDDDGDGDRDRDREDDSATVAWPSFNDSGHVMSLLLPQPRVETEFASIHHCSFWLPDQEQIADDDDRDTDED